MSSLLGAALSLLPVLVFLIALVALDSYQLVKPRSVAGMLLAGAAVGVVCLVAHRALLASGMDPVTLARNVAPATEETLKGAVIVYLLRRHRIGFPVDAAIAGFTVGTGFATFENLQYMSALGASEIGLWVIRGFGTAIMHGGVTAIMAVLAKQGTDRRGSATARSWLPALALAIALHAVFNRFLLTPRQSAIALLVILPAVFALIFRSSQRATKEWLGTGFDTDVELLEMIGSGRASETRVGAYLESLRRNFRPEMLVDMLCQVRLHLELSVKAKALLLAREAGFDLEPAADAREQLEEMRHLERAIGRTGNLALKPIFNVSSRDLWQIHLLQKK